MIHALALVLYIAAFFLWLRTLQGGRRREGKAPAGASWSPGLAGSFAAGGVVLHALALVRYTERWGELPLVGLAPSLSTLALLIGAGLVVAALLGEAGRIGILLVPLIVILEGAALALGVEPAATDLDFRGGWFALHVTLALTSMGAVAVAAAAGTLWLAQFRQLRSRRLGKLFHFLPPLTTLDTLGRVSVTGGLVTLTLSILLGWAWTLRFRGSLLIGDPKTLWSLAVWGVFVALFLLRRGDSGERRGAVGALVGFVLVVGSYVVVRLVESGGFFL